MTCNKNRSKLHKRQWPNSPSKRTLPSISSELLTRGRARLGTVSSAVILAASLPTRQSTLSTFTSDTAPSSSSRRSDGTATNRVMARVGIMMARPLGGCCCCCWWTRAK
ncbi:hypothetical protein L249_0298 [Ophiocordyceps polyrhachis-furcata BCC 54312]|uniref:Uncharacterized protein n=1 Tax=Ophiocordyceps polyrhachis-furcata BCC 54312 TaxID=1330021 RepID=A0A367LDP0_9HYPO|nr:hypothetical protein L249_0298 [Ophiocordyceps polyrhachis-furcata BCC 54312]